MRSRAVPVGVPAKAQARREIPIYCKRKLLTECVPFPNLRYMSATERDSILNRLHSEIYRHDDGVEIYAKRTRDSIIVCSKGYGASGSVPFPIDEWPLMARQQAAYLRKKTEILEFGLPRPFDPYFDLALHAVRDVIGGVIDDAELEKSLERLNAGRVRFRLKERINEGEQFTPRDFGHAVMKHLIVCGLDEYLESFTLAKNSRNRRGEHLPKFQRIACYSAKRAGKGFNIHVDLMLKDSLVRQILVGVTTESDSETAAQIVEAISTFLGT